MKQSVRLLASAGFLGRPPTCSLVHWNGVGVSEQVRFILGERSTDEDTDILANDGMLGNTSTLEGLKSTFEEKPLLRVHRNGLLLRQTKEGRIKGGKIDIQEVSSNGVQCPALSRVGVVETLVVEPLFWYLGPPRSRSSA